MIGLKAEMISRVEAICKSERPSEDDMEFIYGLCESRDPELRLRAAEALGIVPPSEKSSEYLKKLAADSDELVCTEAMDSIAVNGDMTCMDVLRSNYGSGSYFIRGYAACSAAELSRRSDRETDGTAFWLESLLKDEEDEWVRQNICGGLVLLGRNEYLEKLESGLESEDFYIKEISGSLLELIAEYRK